MLQTAGVHRALGEGQVLLRVKLFVIVLRLSAQQQRQILVGDTQTDRPTNKALKASHRRYQGMSAPEPTGAFP